MTRAYNTATTQQNSGGAVNPFTAGKNKLINGDFAINQRNFSSATADESYGFDRWYILHTGGCTYSAQTFTPGTAPVAGYEARNFARLVTTAQSASGDLAWLSQRIEGVRNFAGQTATISFWAKAASGTPKVAVEFDQQFGSGGSTRVPNYAGQVTLSTSWARYSLTITIPSISGKTIGTASDFLGVNLWISAGSSFNSRTGSLGIQNNTFDFWGVQVEAGSVATPFQTATGTIQGELAACHRYYQLIGSGRQGDMVANVAAYNSTECFGVYFTKVTMRTAPTLAITTGTNFYRLWGNSLLDGFDSLLIDEASPQAVRICVTSGIAATQGFAYWVTNNNASSFLALQAEL